MTLAIKLVREVINANPCTNFQIRMSIRLAVRALTNRQTHTQTHGTNSITPTADVGGKNTKLSNIDGWKPILRLYFKGVGGRPVTGNPVGSRTLLEAKTMIFIFFYLDDP